MKGMKKPKGMSLKEVAAYSKKKRKKGESFSQCKGNYKRHEEEYAD